MDGGEEWVMRPVSKGYCKFESLMDGTLNLGDVARMNAAIDVEMENELRLRKAND